MDRATGTDFTIKLNDGTTVNVDIGGATTVQGVFDAIHSASARLTAGFDATGLAITLTDTGTGITQITQPAGSTAAADLGLLSGSASGNVFTGSYVTEGASDLLVTQTNGSKVYIDLSGATTLQDVFDAFADGEQQPLTAALNSTGTAIIVTDTSGGSGTLSIGLRNDSTAGVTLGIVGSAPSNSKSTLTGATFALANTILTGGTGDDTIYGSSGNNLITGNGGSDTLVGGSGVDTLVESGASGYTLSDSKLIIPGVSTENISGFDRAILTGTSAVNTIDTSAFSGPVVLYSAGGLDTLIGSKGESKLRCRCRLC